MPRELPELLDEAERNAVTVVTFFARLERHAGHVVVWWTVMVRVGGAVKATAEAGTQEEALFEALEALRLPCATA